MQLLKALIIIVVFASVGCAGRKQIYADRLVDYGNRHIYVNDKLDFSIWYYDVISKKLRQTESLKLKKTSIPPQLQAHLKQSVKKPSELLFTAHRTSMSSEDLVAVLYKNKGDLIDFSRKIKENLEKTIPKDSILFNPYQTATGYFLNNKAFQDGNYRGSDFIQNRPFNSLTYKLHNEISDYKIHEFHIAFNNRLTLRLMWIADIHKTDKNTIAEWEKIDEQNHYLELFTLNDSAKYQLWEVIPSDFHKLAQDAFKEYGYPGAVNALRRYEEIVEKKGTDAQKNDYYQESMIYQSFLGENKAALKYVDKFSKPFSSPISDNYFDGSEVHDAAEYILQNVENQQVVMFDETHSCGQNRAFMRDLLRGLHEKGFRYLAIETLKYADSINTLGYPLRHKNGFYANEPVFGQMLRESKLAGFQLYEYENRLPCPSGIDCQNFREQQQAFNLKKILDKDPNAKILVWAGHGHIWEEEQLGLKMMALYFKNLTNVNPLTIEQTLLKETSSEETDPGYLKAAIKKWHFKKPIIVKTKDRVFVHPELRGKVDLQVFFPRTEYPNDYPHWMGNSETTFYDLNLDKDYYKDKLLMIFIQNEYVKEVEGAVPVMNIPLSRIGNFRLFLKPDKYVAVIRDLANWEYLYKEFDVKQ